VCPDCAEEVLAAARKCRFCGYRFEPPVRERRAQPAGGGGLLDVLRVSPPAIDDVSGLVEEWGLELWPDEVVRDDGLCFAEIDGVLGYVLVTSSRFRFVVTKRGRRGEPEVRVNRELHRLRSAVVERRRLRKVAVLRFDDDELVVRVETGPPAQLVGLLLTV
jgi:uncharacterized protein UPF0547